MKGVNDVKLYKVIQMCKAAFSPKGRALTREKGIISEDYMSAVTQSKFPMFFVITIRGTVAGCQTYKSVTVEWNCCDYGETVKYFIPSEGGNDILQCHKDADGIFTFTLIDKSDTEPFIVRVDGYL